MDLFMLCVQEENIPFLAQYENSLPFSYSANSHDNNEILYSSTCSIIEVTTHDGSSFLTESLGEVKENSFQKITKKEAVSFSSIILNKKRSDFSVLFGPKLCNKPRIQATLKGLGEVKPVKVYLLYPLSDVPSSYLFEICKLLTDDDYILNLTYPSDNENFSFLEFERKSIQKYTSLEDSLQKILGEIKGALRFANKNTVKQIENFISISNFLRSGDIPLNFHDWPVSPDIALLLINLINKVNYDLIVETGSGTSTFLISKTLEHKRADSTKFISLEHDVKYRKETLQLLSDIDKSYYDVIHSPLSNLEIDDQNYSYYSIDSALLEFLEREENFKAKRVLLFVDGPPGKLNKNARYPIIKLFEPIFKFCEVTIVLDDANRVDEKNTVDLWCKDFANKGLKVKIEQPKTEKGCIILQVAKGE